MQTQCQIQKSHHTTLLKESCLWLSRLFAVHFSDRGLKNKKQKKKTRITFNYHVRLRISDHRFKVKVSLYRIRKRRTGSTYFLIKTFTASQKLSAYLQHKTKFRQSSAHSSDLSHFNNWFHIFNSESSLCSILYK